MTINTYTCLGKFQLSHCHTVKITHDGDVKRVAFTSTIHVNREKELTFCFADTFTDREILNDRDVMTKFIEMYGVGSLL